MRKLTIAILIIILLSCNGSPDTASGATPANRYIENELKEYNGTKLGSLNDFRNNAIKGTQNIDINKYKLTIDGLVKNNASYSYKDLQDFEHIKKMLILYCVEGWNVNVLWEGILLSDLFKFAVPDKSAKTVIFHAADGYTTSIPLHEILDRNLMIADKANGVTLPDFLGYPYILVAEEKWGYKWARWITRIELSSDTDYKGYWEKRGYNNNGDLLRNFLEK